jgi:hypothetical protein
LGDRLYTLTPMGIWRWACAVVVLGLGGPLALAAPASAAGTVTITGVAPVAGIEGSFAGEQGTFTDTNAVSSTALTVIINWGDGTGFDYSATITEVGGAGGTTYTFAADHAFPEEGSFTPFIEVTENANSFNADSATTAATIADARLSAPRTTPTSFSGAGSPSASNSLAAFEASIGGTNNGTTPAEQPGGFRHITWDGIALTGTAGSTVISPGHAVALAPTRAENTGIVIPGPTALANDGFVSINPGVGSPTRFPAFSAPNVVAPFNGNQLELDIVTPANSTSTPTIQATRGLGLMFLNVREPNTTAVTYYDGNAALLTAFAPVGGEGQPSFLGELFPTAVVTRVVVTLGTAQIFNFDGATTSSGPSDSLPLPNLVAADDVVLAEPTPPNPTRAAVARTAISGVVSSFMDGDPNGVAHDYRATVDWGDGSRSTGTVTAGAAGTFQVSASHSYARPGNYAAAVTITDFGGAQRETGFAIRVSPRSTSTGVHCAPPSIRVRATTRCTATVSDTHAAGASAPIGTIAFRSNSSGAFAPGGCTLRPTATAGRSSCSVTYSPTAVGSGTHRITATYGGDAVHAGSAGVGSVAVTGAR